MVERGRIMAAVAKKSVIIPMIFALTLVAVTIFTPKAEALNEPASSASDRITGLWSTGVDNNGNPLNLPGPWPTPTPPPRTSPPWNNEYQAAPYDINNAEDIIQDPHWRLIEIQNSANNSPHCQSFSGTRSAVVLMPTWDGADDPTGNGWIWWRKSIADPANQLVNGSFYARGARWIGARPNAYHDTEGGNGINGPSNGPCVDQSHYDGRTFDDFPVFVYRLKGGFNVGTCVNENSIQLNMYWAADDYFQLILNDEDPAHRKVIVPLTNGGGVVTQTALSSGSFKQGINTLTVKVTSMFPLQGFALAWDEPNYECNRPQPYFKVYGNDTAAGGDIAPCDLSSLPNNRATILAHNLSAQAKTYDPNIPDHMTGASSQLGVFALGHIGGFSSGGTQSPRRRNVPSSPNNGLTFGNFGDPPIQDVGNWDTAGNILDPNRVPGDGGKSGLFRCIPNYYDIASSSIGGTPSSANTINNLSSVTNGYYKPTGGVLEISAASGLGLKRTIVVDGDVWIRGDISLNNSFTASTVPSLYIIAKGNIHIDYSVRNISGVFVAQRYDTPKASGDPGGTIYTCSNEGSTHVRPFFASNLNSGCKNSLTITGAFIANRIRLLRTNGQVKDSEPNETWSPNDNIAEIFKSSTALYLSAPNHLQKPTSGSVKYDSIVSLPPIL